jgi:hypothetical protein
MAVVADRLAGPKQKEEEELAKARFIPLKPDQCHRVRKIARRLNFLEQRTKEAPLAPIPRGRTIACEAHSCSRLCVRAWVRRWWRR